MIAIGSDHGGFELKNHITKYLIDKGIEIKDFGAYSEDSCDYPDIAEKLSELVAAGDAEKAILVCGTGIGVSISANKVKGIRAALCGDVYSARMTRKHNDANVLCLGGRVIGRELAFMICDAFLSEEFEGGRHQVRVDKIHAIENKQ